MKPRLFASVLVLGVPSLVAIAAQSNAAPGVGAAGTSQPSVGTSGPALTARPQHPRFVGVRAAPGVVYTSGRFGWEVEIENPFGTTIEALIIIDNPPGSAVYTLRPNQRAWFPFSRALLMDACTPKQAWTMWMEPTPDQKRVFEMTPNCTFKAAPPTPPKVFAASTAAVTSQIVAGRVSYSGATIKTPIPTCGQPLAVEAEVTNRTAGRRTSLHLDLGNFDGAPFQLDAGASKRVSAGQSAFAGWRGVFPLALGQTSAPNDPIIVPGSFVTEVTAECRPTFQMRGFVATP